LPGVSVICCRTDIHEYFKKSVFCQWMGYAVERRHRSGIAAEVAITSGRLTRDMRILLLMIPISLVLLGIAVWAFVWAVRRGQFDDLDAPALDILVEEDAPHPRLHAKQRHGETDAG